MFKHSKHPWSIVKHKDYQGNLLLYSIKSADQKTVAEIFVQNDATGDVSPIETGNAQVINAAPEMLEVLELIQSWFLATDSTHELVGILHYTILKAKGKLGFDKEYSGLV